MERDMKPTSPVPHVVKPLDAKDEKPKVSQKKTPLVIFFVYIVLIGLGLATGYLLSSNPKISTLTAQKGTTINTSKVIGVQDASTFSDCASGKLEKGGLNGEGTHALIRDGGPSQTAYVFSSVIDLDPYVNLSVKVCGQTVKGKNVSWLMDIGRLELL